MKIGITGDTRGIGSWIKEYYESEGHEVIGISTKDNVSLSDVNAVYDLFKDCDVFVNNAYQSFAQTRLLYHFYDKWRDTNKRIISIGSSAATKDAPFHLPEKFWKYKTHKIALAEASRQSSNDSGTCRVTLFSPGVVDTDMTAYVPTSVKRMSKEQVMECFRFIATATSNIQNVTFCVE